MDLLHLFRVNGQIKDSSNYPLEIWALDKDSQVGTFFAKPFRKNNINSYPTAKEILACEIASRFDLPTARYGIIDISDAKLSSFYTDNQIKRFHSGYKFCSKKLDGYITLSPIASTGFLRSFEIAGIFAFDVIMQNSDRGGFRGKPNLIIKDDSLVMIDHELTLSFIDENHKIPNYENNINIYPHYYHVLMPHLKAIKEKNHIFDEFLEYFHLFNLNTLDEIFDEMDKFNIEYGDRLDYFLYFDWCKKNLNIIKKYLLLKVHER